MSKKSENRINKTNILYEIMIITYNKLKLNWYVIIIFAILGILLAYFGFDLDKDSYNSLFNTMATITLALVGFIGIFVALLLETNRDSILDYVADINRLREDKLKIYDYIPITKSSTIKNIDTVLDYIQKTIDLLNHEIDGHIKGINILKEDIYKTKEKERGTLINIKNILENLEDERIKLGKYLSCFKDTFIFAIFSILLFTIPIALNHINFSNENYSTLFKNVSFFKMFFTGFLFGLFFVILKDSAFILKKTFDNLDFFRQNQDGG